MELNIGDTVSKTEVLSYRTETCTDGIVIFKDPGTRKTKKNRHRKIRDGAPKCMRGRVNQHDSNS